jgi:hypothetical protein
MDKVIRYFATLVCVVVLASCEDAITPPPSPPTDVTATLSAPTTVQLAWKSRPAAERIIAYSVYRNGKKIGESTETTFLDAGLAEAVTLEYSVSAIAESQESPRSPVVSVTTRDATAPRVVQNFPATGAGPVPVLSALVTIAFSESMDSASINASTLVVRMGPAGPTVPGTVTYNSQQQYAQFNPGQSGMPPDATIVVTATTGIKDRAGNPLAAPFTFNFTTTENTPPTLIGTSPANGETGVSLDLPRFSMTFSERMSPFISAALFDNTLGTLVIASAEAYDTLTNTQHYAIRERLRSNHHYAVQLEWTGPITDIAGNRLVGDKGFSFVTLDEGPPLAISTSPAKDATGVDPATQIKVTFSEALDPATVTAANFQILGPPAVGFASGTVSYDPATFTAIFTPAAPLVSGVRYAVILNNMKDATGVAMESNFAFFFNTR